MPEEHALFGDAIQMRCGRNFRQRPTIRGNGVQRVIIREDEQDVWGFFVGGMCHATHQY